jgi:uncharacterized protein (DUF1778 family)
MTTRTTRSEKLDLRLTPQAKRTLAAAAAAERRSISDYVLESALGRAEETLADRRSFGLDAERWQAFMKVLDAPVRDMACMSKLLREPGTFSGGETT